MTQNSILLENVDSKELKEIILEAVKTALSAIQPVQNKYLSRQEAAAKFGISLPTLDKGLRNGSLAGYRINGRILLKESELELSKMVVRKRRK
jgi:excisionase family DNA binding protein